MYLAVSLGLVHTLVQWNYEMEIVQASGMSVSYLVFLTLLGNAFLVLLILQAARRHRNWARWTLFILFMVSIVGFFPRTLNNPNPTTIAMTVKLGETLAMGIALFLVFTGNARDWFRPSQSPA